MTEELTIQAAAERTGLSVHTLRYYERVGLLQAVGRADNGHRRYTADDLEQIGFLQCLRESGMSIQQMCAFARLRDQGDATIAERIAFLQAHQRQVQEHICKLERTATMLESKVQRYRARSR